MLYTLLIINELSAPSHLAESLGRQNIGYRTITITGSEHEIWKIISGSLPYPDLVLIDMSGTQQETLRIIREIRTYKPQLPIMVLTPYGSDEHALPLIDAGASDFLAKPVSMERLNLSLQNILKMKHMSHAIARLERKHNLHTDFLDTITEVASNISLFDKEGHIRKLRSIEEDVIRFALKHAGGCMTRAARNLGIGRSTLYRKIEEMATGTPGAYMERANQATRPIITISAGEAS